MAKKPTPKQNDKTQIPLSPTLKTVPAIDGVDELRRLHHLHGLIPDTAVSTIEKDLSQLEDLLSQNSVTTYNLATDQSSVLSILTGVPHNRINQYHATELADRLHTYRNLALAVAALAASTIGVVSPATHPVTVYAHAAKLARRSVLTRRPLADDEIVLCRVAAHLAAQQDPRDHAAMIYTLIDAGLVPGETTHVKIDDIDDPERPQLLLAAGNAHVRARFVDLDRFATHLVRRHIEQSRRAGHSPHAPLTYRARVRKGEEKHQPGSVSATASAQRIIDRLIQQLGLPTGDITASSITQWRIASTLATRGVDAAWAASGRTNTNAMFRALGTVPAQSSVCPSDDLESFAAAA